MSKLREDFRIGMLGAAAGLFSLSVALLIARVDAYYGYLSWLAETNYGRYERGVEDLWWIPFGFWHILLSVVASLMVHRYLKMRVRSPFMLWQVVGLTALLGWGLSVFLAVSLECVSRGNPHPLEHLLNLVELGSIAKYVSAVFACNVVYGSVMQASSRQYA